MNLFTSKKYYSDNGVCSFHEFARELDEDYLRTQVNGGDCGGGAPSPSPSAQGSSGSSGGSGSGGGAGHGTGGTSSSGTTTTPQSPAVNPGAGETQNSGNQSNPGYTGGGGNYEPPKEVMSNPQAYAYWLSLQDKAIKEGDPGKYKDYNVLGDHGKKQVKTTERSIFDEIYKDRKTALTTKEQVEMSKLAERREKGGPIYDVIVKNSKACIKFLDIGSLNDVVKGQSPYISGEEKANRISDIKELNNLTNKEVFYPGEELLAPDSVVPDITESLTELMNKNSQDPNIANPFYFKEKVQSGGDWDLKTNKDSIYLTKPLQYKNYIFEGEILRYDAPGNIHYGYTGASTWWGNDSLLFWGAGKAQIQDNPNGGWTGDDIYDAYCIQKGIDLYKRNQ